MGSTPRTVRAQNLLGREVRDSNGKTIGRVYDLATGHIDGALRVTALLIGPGAWLTRFGWTTREHGRRIAWEDVESLGPPIRLRR